MLLTILWMVATAGCAHGHLQARTEPAPGYSDPSIMEADASNTHRHDGHAEDGYVYAAGFGKLPEDSPSEIQGWARAKRAAIDDATANLLVVARKQQRPVAAGRHTGKSPAGKEAMQAASGPVRGRVSQAEIVSIRRLRDGSCEVLMRSPRSRILTTE